MGQSSTGGNDLLVFSVLDLGGLTKGQLAGAITTYQQAFRGEPYEEDFSLAHAERNLRNLLERDGHLLLGQLDKHIVALAGGYPRVSSYYIDELAVTPEHQGRGFGQRVLRALLEVADPESDQQLEIRTSVRNTRALELYRSIGFRDASVVEVVPQRRVGGQYLLDQRVTLWRPPVPGPQVGQLNRVVVAYPSGNTTALVLDQCLELDRKQLNGDLMQAWKDMAPQEPEIEQCGFLTMPVDSRCVARVEMMGGEFCGNATRSAAWLLSSGEPNAGLIEASGVDRPLAFTVKNGEVSLEMPLPIEVANLIDEVPEGTLVHLDGITHLVRLTPPHEASSGPSALLTELLGRNLYGLAGEPAVGVTDYDSETQQAQFAVWVKAVDTVFDETACGSGTSAIGVALSGRAKASTSVPVRQPSGETITTVTDTADDGRVNSSVIVGAVRVIYDGEFKLNG